MNNKKTGNKFETEFCKILFNNGFWVHNMAQNASGQPADVIATKNGKPHLIDCKVFDSKLFRRTRIEENQHLSMKLWRDCGNAETWFAFKIKSEIVMIRYNSLMAMFNGGATISVKELMWFATPINRWVNECK